MILMMNCWFGLGLSSPCFGRAHVSVPVHHCNFTKNPLYFLLVNLSDNKIIAKDLVFPTTDHRKTECIQIIGGGI